MQVKDGGADTESAGLNGPSIQTVRRWLAYGGA